METSEIFIDSAPIKALGSLFKLTEIHLRDDGCSSDYRQISSYPKHIRFVYDDDDDDDDDREDDAKDVKVDFEAIVSSNTSVETTVSIVMEDADLFREMSTLGLPLTFQTSKQSNAQPKGRHKGTQHKDQVLVPPKLSNESPFYVTCRDKPINSSSLSALDQAELSCSESDLTDDAVKLSSSCDEEKPGNTVDETGNGDLEKLSCEKLTGKLSNEELTDDLLGTDLLERRASRDCYLTEDCVGEHSKELDINLMEHIGTKESGLGNAMKIEDLESSIFTAKTQVSGMLIDSGNVLDDVYNEDIGFSAVCGQWSAFWDSFYMRYYFYNSETQESTWYPPRGMESFACVDISNVFDEAKTEVNSDPTNSHTEEQFDRQELVDKTGSDEQTGDKVASTQELTGEELSSGLAVHLEIPCSLNICDQQILHGKCYDENNLSLSLSTVNHIPHLENESEQENSCGLSTWGFPSKDFVSVGSLNESDNKNFNGSIVARVSDASSLSGTLETACVDDLFNCERVEELETLTEVLCRKDTFVSTKQKKKRKNRRRKKSLNINDYEFPPVDENSVDITKYWCQRYLLFSKFNDGVRMDEEGWFSVTPEAIARHHASRCIGGIIIDCFAGVGGNVIQFAKTNKYVIAVDIDPRKIDYAHHNAAIYGVEDRIDFINEDCFSLATKLKADTVFLSPPWGGPDYLKLKSYDLSMLRPHDGKFLFDTFKSTASLIVMFLPRNVDIIQLAELCLSSDNPWSLEVEKNFLNGKLKAITAYFGKPS